MRAQDYSRLFSVVFDFMKEISCVYPTLITVDLEAYRMLV